MPKPLSKAGLFFAIFQQEIHPQYTRQEKQDNWQKMSIEEHMELYESQGMDKKTAMKQVSKDRGLTKREIYQYLLEN